MISIEVDELHYITLKLSYQDAKKLANELDENAKFCMEHGRNPNTESLMNALYNCLPC